MSKNRLEAMSDGVIAIIITIMVLELAVPHEASLSALRPLVPVLLSYVLSFINIAIYWNNHHLLLGACQRISASAMWANMHLLFWLSLVPFGTAWMGETGFATLPVAAYGTVLLMAALAYTILALTLVRANGHDSALATALGRDTKGRLSLGLYLIAIPLAFVNAWIACALFVVVAVIWFIPDRRLARRTEQPPS